MKMLQFGGDLLNSYIEFRIPVENSIRLIATYDVQIRFMEREMNVVIRKSSFAIIRVQRRKRFRLTVHPQLYL